MSAGSEGADRLLELEDVLLLLAVVLLPWAFGGVEIWAYRSAAVLIAASGSVALWKRGWRGWGLGGGAGWLWPAFLLAAWAAVQLVPLPPGMIRVLSPEAHRLYAASFPRYDEGGAIEDPLKALEREALEAVPDAAAWPEPAAGGDDVTLASAECLTHRRRTLSVEPSATQERLLWYGALLIGFLVLRQRVGDRRRRRIYRWVLFGLCAALAAFALVQLQFWNGKIYWVRRLLVVANPFGPYFNPTNLAGVMELAVPAMAGFAWTRLRAHGRLALSQPGFGVASAGAFFCLVAGLAAASKLAALLIVAGLFALVLIAGRTARARLTVAGILVAVVAIGALLLVETRLGERLELFLGRSQDATLLEGRVAVWRASGEMLQDFLVTGAGFGTFREMFQRYLPAGASNRWAQAHNDYLEVLLDGGLIAGALVVWLAWGFCRRAVHSLRHSGLSPGHVGIAVGVASLAIHAVADFNHQIPADALLWLAFCGMLVPGATPGPSARWAWADRRWVVGLVIALLLAGYGYRTAGGIRGGWGLDRGHLARNFGDYDDAVPLLQVGAVGGNTRRALLILGEVLLNEWDVEVREQGALGADPTLLEQAADAFQACRCAAPAARRAWKGLGEVYDSIEWIGRERRSESPYVVPEHPWERVGRPGRIAVGMLRNTVSLSPNWVRSRDSLALIYWNYGLEDLARESVRDSARVLPLYGRHPYRRIPEMPDWVLEEFAAGSRSVLGQVPLLARGDHLLDLGRLERQNGNSERAVEIFRGLLSEGGDDLRVAELNFQLALALMDEGRDDEARSHLESARKHPVFRPSALRELARIAERKGDPSLALEHLRRLRWEMPGELWPCLEFSALARRMKDWDAALEALRWAKVKHPDEVAPYVSLAETHIEMSHLAAAKAVTDELAAIVGDDATEVVDLRNKIDARQ